MLTLWEIIAVLSTFLGLVTGLDWVYGKLTEQRGRLTRLVSVVAGWLGRQTGRRAKSATKPAAQRQAAPAKSQRRRPRRPRRPRRQAAA